MDRICLWLHNDIRSLFFWRTFVQRQQTNTQLTVCQCYFSYELLKVLTRVAVRSVCFQSWLSANFPLLMEFHFNWVQLLPWQKSIWGGLHHHEIVTEEVNGQGLALWPLLCSLNPKQARNCTFLFLSFCQECFSIIMPQDLHGFMHNIISVVTPL